MRATISGTPVAVLAKHSACAGQALALRSGAPARRALKRNPGSVGVVSHCPEGGGGPAPETVLVRSGSNSASGASVSSESSLGAVAALAGL
jgi:hypothetical protein